MNVKLLVATVCLAAFGLVGWPSVLAHANSQAVQTNNQDQPSLSELHIQSAWYGAGAQSDDVTRLVRQLLSDGTTQIKVGYQYFRDAAPGFHKKLIIRYMLRGVTKEVSLDEGQGFDFTDLLTIEKPGSIHIVYAGFGGADVTLKVRKAVSHGTLSIPANGDWLGVGDPQPGVHKKLTVLVEYPDGTRQTREGEDGSSVMLVTEPLVTVDRVSNGSFDTTDVSAILSEMAYVPNGTNVLNQRGVYTIAPGIMRPLQLHSGLRWDFIQHTRANNSMAMFINPVSGRQPVLLWSEKVKAVPNTFYKLVCYCADISDNDGSAAATIVLEVNGVRTDPYLIEEADTWGRFYLIMRTGPKDTATLKIWRDVLPPGADRGSLIAIDDISFEPGSS